MSGIQSLNQASESQSPLSGKRPQSSILDIDSWMPSAIPAISPLVDRLMRLIEGSQCVRGAEQDVELALREALDNAVSTHPLPLLARQGNINRRDGSGKRI